jgi:DNA repair ATPase RecN
VDNLRKDVARVEEKLDKVADELSQIRVVQAEQASDLKYHIQRTSMNEQRIETVENRLIPVFELKNRIDGVFLILGKAATGLGLIFAGIKAVETVLKYL